MISSLCHPLKNPCCIDNNWSDQRDCVRCRMLDLLLDNAHKLIVFWHGYFRQHIIARRLFVAQDIATKHGECCGTCSDDDRRTMAHVITRTHAVRACCEQREKRDF